MRRQVLAWLEDRKHHCDQSRDLLTNAPGFRAALDIPIGAETVATQHKRLPAVVLADGGDVRRELVESGQVVFAGEHAIELAADQAPLALDFPAPGKHRFVVYRRIAHLAVLEIQPFYPSDHAHEGADDKARPSKRLDAGGPEILDRILDGFRRLSCDTQGSPRNNSSGSTIAMVKRRRKRIGGRAPGSYALLAKVSNEASGVSIRSRRRPNDRTAAAGGRGRSAAMALRPAQPMAAFSAQRPGAIGLGLACLLGQLRLLFDLESGRLPRTRHARTLPEIHRRGGPLLSARMPHKGRTTTADRYVVSALILDECLYHSFAVVTLEPGALIEPAERRVKLS